MSNTYKMVTLIGTSPESYEAAIDNALTDASVSLRNISWFEVVEMRGSVHEGRAPWRRAPSKASSAPRRRPGSGLY